MTEWIPWDEYHESPRINAIVFLLDNINNSVALGKYVAKEFPDLDEDGNEFLDDGFHIVGYPGQLETDFFVTHWCYSPEVPKND